MEDRFKSVEERPITKKHGIIMLILLVVITVLSIAALIGGCILLEEEENVFGGILLAAGLVGGTGAFCLIPPGLKSIKPNEALVLTLFGNYHGTIKEPGFYFVNPFCAAVFPESQKQTKVVMSEANNRPTVATTVKRKISTKVMTLDNNKQKVNDQLGNPIIVGTVVIWQVSNPTQAVFSVENYTEYLSIQCDTITRNTARLYPYDDTNEDGAEEVTLRGNSTAIAENMQEELQKRVADAGLTILDVRITHLAYAEEIAAAMLQRQQATAIIAARKKIVEGAVSMVKMAIDNLNDDGVVVLDEERKAAMVSNLLVVLCGNKEAQPIVNSGSLY